MKREIRRRRAAMAWAGAALVAAAVPAHGQTLVNLLDRLRAKGVITEAEYQQIRGDQQEAANAANLRFRDGFTLESADRRHAIGLGGRIHADYRSFDKDSGSAAAANAGSADTFDVRRAYLGLAGRFYNDWTFDVTADLAQTGVALDVAWINYALSRGMQLRAGQFKMPFSLEELTSSRFIDFQERGLPNALVPGKERGFMVHGAPATGIYYGLAASTGQGKNTNETNAAVDDKDVIGRLALNAAQMLGRRDAVLHFGGSFSRGTLPVAVPPAGRSEGRGITFFSAAAFTGAGTTGVQSMDRDRRGLEAALAFRQFKLQSEVIRTSFGGTSNAGTAFDRAITASYVGMSWLLTGETYGEAYSGGAFAAVRPRQAFGRGAGWGAWEAGLRLSRWNAGDFAATNPAGTGVLTAGATNGARAWTAGLKWIPNTNTRIYFNVVKTKFDSPVSVVNGTADDETAITMRAAFHF